MFEPVHDGGEPGEAFGRDMLSGTGVVGEQAGTTRPDEVGQHGRPRPQGRCPRVRPAPPPHHVEVVPLGVGGGSLAEPGLADSGLAGDDGHLAPARQGAGAQARHKSELAVPPDELLHHGPSVRHTTCAAHW
ncbi:MAG TPA: hypothetical protein VNA67_07475 [Pseudonocardiaceae bacterium]|nr:hypothetical protein [Pseudonocardiaceae bacterium]